MSKLPIYRSLALTAMCALGAACQPTADVTTQTLSRPDRVYPTNANWPDTLYVFGTGYPKSGDPCRAIGESDVVRRYLDHTQRLYGCPTVADAQALGGQIVGKEGDITLVSVRDPGQ